MKALAFFTHRVTLPLLNCVAQGSQDDLVRLFPELWNDLKQGDMNTLSRYEVAYKHVPVASPSNTCEQKLVKLMCEDAAKTIERQCGREYGFGKDYGIGTRKRATDLLTTSPDDRKSMPTDNVIAERNFAKFDHLARVAKCRNHNFTAKGIRQDMMLYQAKDSVVQQTTKAMEKILQKREISWNHKQKQILFESIQDKLAKKAKSSYYTNRLLQSCKSWNGPAVGVEELQQILTSNSDNNETIVRTELAYYRQTHPYEVRSNPDLFKLQGQGISHKERLENLCLILADGNISESNNATTLPTNQDLLQSLNLSDEPASSSISEVSVCINDLCAAIWVHQNVTNWHIGYVTCRETENSFMVEHLKRCNNNNITWQYCEPPEELEVQSGQLLLLKPIGTWDITNIRQTKFILSNHAEMQQAFDEMNL